MQIYIPFSAFSQLAVCNYFVYIWSLNDFSDKTPKQLKPSSNESTVPWPLLCPGRLLCTETRCTAGTWVSRTARIWQLTRWQLGWRDIQRCVQTPATRHIFITTEALTQNRLPTYLLFLPERIIEWSKLIIFQIYLAGNCKVVYTDVLQK